MHQMIGGLLSARWYCRYLAAFAGSLKLDVTEGGCFAAIYEQETIMENIFLKKQTSLAVSCALALGLVAGSAAAQTNPANNAYVKDQRGGVVMSGTGLCWHSGTGPAPESTPECDPNYAPPPVAKAAEMAPQPAVAVAETPTPAPAAVVPVVERMSLDADALFDFDKATLRPAGRITLDEFFARLKDIQPEMITAIGHADRFGSNGYNQRLSERRVEAVKAYLVGKGLAPERMQTEGKGESEPVTKAGECDGAKSSKVIACLQPDRRVEVEVTGNRMY